MGRLEQGVEKSGNRYRVIPRTLCFIRNDRAVLLLRGSAGKRLWANLYNGIGGHVERGEGVAAAALREVREECGLEVNDLRLAGTVNIDSGHQDTGIVLFVFTATAASRAVRDSIEGTPVWFDPEDLPWREMVSDLPMLLPRVLSRQPGDPPFSARYYYDASDNLNIEFDSPT